MGRNHETKPTGIKYGSRMGKKYRNITLGNCSVIADVRLHLDRNSLD